MKIRLKSKIVREPPNETKVERDIEWMKLGLEPCTLLRAIRRRCRRAVVGERARNGGRSKLGFQGWESAGFREGNQKYIYEKRALFFPRKLP